MSMSQTLADRSAARRFWLGVAAYMLPTFLIAAVWHLILFAPAYHALAIYREDVIFPFGIAAMLIQGAAFSFVYPKIFSNGAGGVLKNGFAFGIGLAALSWSFTTLAVAAKNVMTSVPTYLALETGFTVIQFAVVGPLIALAHRRG